jgi:hypothetical protein
MYVRWAAFKVDLQSVRGVLRREWSRYEPKFGKAAWLTKTG